MFTRRNILRILADGKFHSGTELGQALGISRAAVNKAVQGLASRGLEIHSVSGKGYKWLSATPLLDAKVMAESLQPILSRHSIRLEVLDEIDSTSAHLLKQLPSVPYAPRVCLAETQTGGRGRRGRDWQSTPYQNLACSISWRFETGPARLSGLSVAAGVAMVRALSGLGIEGVQLKWPNDLLFDRRKLAGILVDIKGEADGPTDIVLGFGLNINLGNAAAMSVDQPWIDLAEIMRRDLDRNVVASAILTELIATLADYGELGLRNYLEDWKKWHAFRDQPVRLLQGQKEVHGVVCGIDESGALKLDTGSEVIVVHSGEVSLRARQ